MSDPRLIWLAGVSWDGIRGTDRHLATALSGLVPLLWVDPPVSAISQPLEGQVRRSWRPRLSRVNDTITRLTPVALPGFTRPGVRTSTAALVRWQVRRAIRQLGLRPSAVVATHLDDVLGYWGSDTVNVLLGTDDYVAGAELLGISAGRLIRHERRALARSDIVAAVSQPLAERWRGLGADAVVIPNGCWLAPENPTKGRPVIGDLPAPVAGLVGQLSERIDIAVLEAVAKSGISLLIVGPKSDGWEAERFARLIRRPRVRYVGPVSSTEVPAYLAMMDIGLTPYQVNAFNHASFPLKTLEYLGAGLPVVSADLPAARWLRDHLGVTGADPSDLLVLADRAEEYVSAIRHLAKVRDHAAQATGSSMTDHARLCRAVAAQHSWPSRASALATAIGLN